MTAHSLRQSLTPAVLPEQMKLNLPQTSTCSKYTQASSRNYRPRLVPDYLDILPILQLHPFPSAHSVSPSLPGRGGHGGGMDTRPSTLQGAATITASPLAS